VLDAILLEKKGIPAIAIVTGPFVETGEAMAASWGIPDYPFLSVPHPIANLTDEEINERVDAVLEQVISLLKDVQGR
jgi:hypothetical protein